MKRHIPRLLAQPPYSDFPKDLRLIKTIKTIKQYLTVSNLSVIVSIILVGSTELMKRNDPEMSLAELAEQSGVPGRTIRFYIARSLLPGPSQAGRGASYGQEHIRQLQEDQGTPVQRTDLDGDCPVSGPGKRKTDSTCAFDLVELPSRFRCSRLGAR